MFVLSLNVQQGERHQYEILFALEQIQHLPLIILYSLFFQIIQCLLDFYQTLRSILHYWSQPL